MVTCFAENVETLIERIATTGHGRVDQVAGVIRDVRILGAKSANGREYTRDAMRGAIGLYEGVKVYADHPGRSTPDGERSVRDSVGWLENVRMASNGSGLTGDLHLLKSHPMTATILEAAERNPRQFGLSHNAEGRTVSRNGRVFVEEIRSVRSVDIVSDPATTKGLFESLGRGRMTQGEFIRRLTEETIPGVSDEPDGGDIGGSEIRRLIIDALRNLLIVPGSKDEHVAAVGKLLDMFDRIGDQDFTAETARDEIRRIVRGEVSAAESIARQGTVDFLTDGARGNVSESLRRFVDALTE